MAIFSVFHLWAYPWRVYDVSQLRIATSEPHPRVALEPATSYSGGPLGARALLDAFNPWDMVKGVGRGFKWFVVGRRAREQDVSYTNSGRSIVLQPVRKVFALQVQSPEDGLLHHQNLSPVDDGSQICIGGSSAYVPSLENEEEEEEEEEEVVVEEDKNPLSKAQSNPSTDAFLHVSSNQHQAIQNNNEKSTNDTSTAILPSESTVSLQEPCSRTGTPQLPLPEFHALEVNFQLED